MRRRAIALLSALTLLLSLAACGRGQEQGEQAAPSADQVALAVLDACGRDGDGLIRTREELDPGGLDDYLEGFFGLSPDDWDDCALYRAEGADAFEVDVFRLTADADRQGVLAGLEEYRQNRQADFTGYAPEQAQLVADGRVLLSEGEGYAALLLCPDPDAAQAAFYAALDQAPPTPGPSQAPAADCALSQAPVPSPEPALTAEPDLSPEPASAPTPAASPEPTPSPAPYAHRQPYVDPNIDDMTLYDTAAILAAWENGDRSALSEKDAAILSAAEEVIGQVITEGMDDYEKEWAVYAWLTVHVDYDYDHYDPLVTMDPDSYGPYGALVNGKGVCLSYATTFQLFMDLLDVECITVVGAAYYSREDHAWNMVRLNGEWYCVDATWDAGGGANGRLSRCDYFNVTSDHMADTNHQWDYESVPEATATDGGK